MAVDIENSTSRTDTAKAHLRRAMYDAFNSVLHETGINEDDRDPLIDRGDGILALLHPVDHVPKTVLLTTFTPLLRAYLEEYGAQHPDQRLRLRAVVHAGEIQYDPAGCFGEALDLSFRLLEAPEVKQQLRRTTAPLVVVVSEDIHRSVVRHGYDGINHRSFKPIARVNVAGRSHRGWVQSAHQDSYSRLRDSRQISTFADDGAKAPL